ncbi:MAG: thioesterase domain-containing protein [Candidatus Devosia symbiotica]|nr:thioesterase domain-containing protein [Candidatus Devosia symbiotica]
MTELELEHYLHKHIPLLRAIGMWIVSIDGNTVVLGAPLAPNINHRDTVFSGKASVVTILSAYCLLHLRLTALEQSSYVVIQRNSMDYLAPIVGDFTARSALTPGQDWGQFMAMLTRKGVARISGDAILDYAGADAGRLTGEFVAFGKNRL